MLSVTTSDIPLELLEEFFECAVAQRRIDLKSAVLVSPRWRELCQRKLFRTIHISAVNVTGIHSVGIRTSHAHLAKYIAEIHVVDLPGAVIPNSHDLLPSHFTSFTSFLHAITNLKHMLLGHSLVDWSKLPLDTILVFLQALGRPSFETLEVIGGTGFPASLLYGANLRTLSMEVVHAVIPPHPSVSHSPIQGRLRVLKLDRVSLTSFLAFLLNEEQLARTLFEGLHVVHLRVHDSILQLPLGSSLAGQFIGLFGHSLTDLHLRIERRYPIDGDESFITRKDMESLVNLKKLDLTFSVGMLSSQSLAADYIDRHCFDLLKVLPRPDCLQNFVFWIRLSVPGRPGLQECVELSEQICPFFCATLESRGRWSSMEAAKFLVELCGDKNTTAAQTDVGLSTPFVDIECIFKTSSIRDFDPGS